MICRNMRLLCMFDLPVATKTDRRNYTKFRNWLIKNGWFMIQFSVYSKVTLNHDDAKKHVALLDRHKPPKGSVRVLQITEKQFGSMAILVGEKTAQEDFLSPKDILDI